MNFRLENIGDAAPIQTYDSVLCVLFENFICIFCFELVNFAFHVV